MLSASKSARQPARHALGLLGAVALAVSPAASADLKETAVLPRSLSPLAAWPGNSWPTRSPAELQLDPERLRQARDYALTGGGSGIIVRHGFQTLAWGDQQQRYDLKSTTKSIGSIALGLALLDGTVRLDDPAQLHDPSFGRPPDSNQAHGWLERITLFHLASQTAGFEKPGGYTPILFEPGTQWDYSDSGPNWLADCLTLTCRRDLQEWMFDRVFTPLGITHKDLTWRDNAYRPKRIEGIPRREFGSGIHANVNALARIGLLLLRQGRWHEQAILDPDFIRLATHPSPETTDLPELHPDTYGNASAHYGLLWWNNADATLARVPTDAFWSWGLYDSLIVVIPSLDLVVARAGQSWQREAGSAHYDVLAPFLVPIATAADTTVHSATTPPAPTPPSPVIREIIWAPPDTILRLAKGSDNWPVASAEGNTLYGAYGDGYGFEPFLPRKLSLGLARIEGAPPHVTGTNLRSPDMEQVGDGPAGIKASGLLMVNGTLYLLARNADNAQLAWSEDQGRTWTWADWRFTESFGCPAFLNYGPNYAGARDEFIYLFSHDSDSAYTRADDMVLARAPIDRVRDLSAYSYFAGLTDSGQPTWTSQVGERAPVFSDPGRCYRSQVTYNPELQRYLWCQTGLGDDTRFGGGFAIYDAPEPWGPWSMAFQTTDWDVGPGETASFPTPWMNQDGTEAYLLFSGDDCFSVRHARFLLFNAAEALTE